MTFDKIQHLRKKAEKNINRAMREAKADNQSGAAALFKRAGITLLTLAQGIEEENHGNKTQTH